MILKLVKLNYPVLCLGKWVEVWVFVCSVKVMFLAQSYRKKGYARKMKIKSTQKMVAKRETLINNLNVLYTIKRNRYRACL